MSRKAPRRALRKSPVDQSEQTEPGGGATVAFLGRIRWDWMAAALALLLLAWVVTEGDWDFFPHGGALETFYDAQAVSLLHGRIDVAPESIGAEAFVRDGKTYGYFGPTPALMRLPLELLLPGMYGRWNCLSMLSASGLAIGVLMLLMRVLEQRFPPAGGPLFRRLLTGIIIFAAAIGSTNFFVSAERKVYQEAIIWASSLALAQAVFLACYLVSTERKWLVLSCAAAFLAFFARVSSGAGSLFSLFLVDAAILVPSRFQSLFGGLNVPRRAAVTISATLVLSAALWAGLNEWKFGTPLTSLPMATNKQFDSERAQRIKGELASLYNLPITVPAYLSPFNIEFLKRFPWVIPEDGDPTAAARFPKAHFDRFEPFVSLPAAMPEFLLAAIAGTALALKYRKEFLPFRAPLVGALAGSTLIFVWGIVTFRYLHDLFPWLVFGSAIATAWVASIPVKWLRRALVGLFVAATLYASWVNVALAVLQQRYLGYPIRPEKRLAFTDLCDAIDGFGVNGLLHYAVPWRRYVPATSFQEGNLLIDRTEMAARGDEPVVRSQGQSPAFATYTVDVPADGDYEIAVRYAAGQSQPVHLLVNGQDVKEVCAAPTQGWRDQEWDTGFRIRLGRGLNRFGLRSDGTMPPISMLRLIGAS